MDAAARAPRLVPSCAGIPAVKMLILFVAAMNSRFSILLAGTFACGFLCAWLAKPAESPPPPEEISAKREIRSPRRVIPDRRESPAMRSADVRIAGILDDGQEWQPGADEDYPSLLAALRRQASLSLTGTKYGFRTLLEDIVLSWYESNPDQALSWVLSVGNAEDQKELLRLVVSQSAKDDWRGAVKLAELYGNTAGGKIRMPTEVRAEVSKLAPEEFARIIQLFEPTLTNWTYEFGGDFQFRETLELLSGKYRHPSLFAEWARRDFAAAWEWSYDNMQSPSQLQDMAEAWSEEVGNDEVAEFAAALMDESNWDPEVAKRRNWGREQWRVEHMHIVGEMLMSRPSPDRFQSLLERVSDRQESLSRLVKFGTYQGSRFREEVLNQMTADERITAFGSIDPGFRSNYMRTHFEEALTLLGHSREEIDWMLPAPAPEDSTQAPESNEPAQDPFD